MLYSRYRIHISSIHATRPQKRFSRKDIPPFAFGLTNVTKTKYGGPPIHSWVHEMQSQNFDKKAHELKLVGYPLLYIPWNIPPRFAAARVAVGRGPYFVNVLRILRHANSIQKSTPSISFQNPPPRQLSMMISLLCVQHGPSDFPGDA